MERTDSKHIYSLTELSKLTKRISPLPNKDQRLLIANMPWEHNSCFSYPPQITALQSDSTCTCMLHREGYFIDAQCTDLNPVRVQHLVVFRQQGNKPVNKSVPISVSTSIGDTRLISQTVRMSFCVFKTDLFRWTYCCCVGKEVPGYCRVVELLVLKNGNFTYGRKSQPLPYKWQSYQRVAVNSRRAIDLEQVMRWQSEPDTRKW